MEALYARLTLRKMNKQLYIHDSLTGLYNRMAYEKLAMPLFHQCMQENQPVGIMFVDADHLKYINDTFGHDMGNLAISSIASVLRQHCPAESVSIRYGGDEFVCVIPDYNKQKIQELAHTLLDSLEVFSANSRMGFPIEASIGWVIADDPDLPLNDYINLADEKMYSVKKSRKAPYRKVSYFAADVQNFPCKKMYDARSGKQELSRSCGCCPFSLLYVLSEAGAIFLYGKILQLLLM